MSRPKIIRTAELREVFDKNWEPVYLVGDAIPPFARSIPKAVLCCVLASGEISYQRAYSSAQIRSGFLVGGIDIYRHSPDDPVAFNKDWYAIVKSSDPQVFMVDGPIRDDEHWIDEIPKRYATSKVIGNQGRLVE